MASTTRQLGFLHLLGGSLTIPNNTKNVRLEMSPTALTLKIVFKKDDVYPLEHVVASVQTEQEITSRVTATRLLTTGIFAFALKKKGAQFHQYLHVTSDEVGHSAEIIFDTDKASQIANEINLASAAVRAPVPTA